jgi:hypothetical protein
MRRLWCMIVLMLLCMAGQVWAKCWYLDSRSDIPAKYTGNAPAVSEAGESRMYYDRAAECWKVSVNGGVYKCLQVVP